MVMTQLRGNYHGQWNKLPIMVGWPELEHIRTFWSWPTWVCRLLYTITNPYPYRTIVFSVVLPAPKLATKHIIIPIASYEAAWGIVIIQPDIQHDQAFVDVCRSGRSGMSSLSFSLSVSGLLIQEVQEWPGERRSFSLVLNLHLLDSTNHIDR